MCMLVVVTQSTIEVTGVAHDPPDGKETRGCRAEGVTGATSVPVLVVIKTVTKVLSHLLSGVFELQ
jgi:hypothetical protein